MRIVLLFVLFVTNSVFAATLEELVKEGVRLHDAGKYELAVEKYKKALKLEPDNPDVMYEMVFSFQAAGKNKQCIEFSEKGLKLDPKYRNHFFATKGSCYSQLGKYEEAIAAFEQGLKEFPDDVGLNFNIAITLYNTGKIKKAISHFKDTIRSKPTYSSPYYMLAQSFHRTGYRIPALYFYMQFVLIEPNTDRSADASKKLFALMNQSVKTNEKGEVQISVNVDSPVDEGDFSAQDMILSMGGALNANDDLKEDDSTLPAVMTLKGLAEMSKKEGDEKLKSTFTWKYALQNMIALNEKDNLVPLIYILAANAGIEGADHWLEQNKDRVSKLFSQRKQLPSFTAGS